MQDARVGRVGDVPDGGRDRHDVRARLCDAELTGRSLRARTLHFFRIVYLKEMNGSRPNVERVVGPIVSAVCESARE